MIQFTTSEKRRWYQIFRPENRRRRADGETRQRMGHIMTMRAMAEFRTHSNQQKALEVLLEGEGRTQGKRDVDELDALDDLLSRRHKVAQDDSDAHRQDDPECEQLV